MQDRSKEITTRNGGILSMYTHNQIAWANEQKVATLPHQARTPSVWNANLL
jgi:hypothetical protein